MASTIDLETADLVPVTKLVQQRLKRRISPATTWRWRVRGVRGVKLPMVLVFGQWHSTEEVLTEFLRASSEAGMPQVEPSAERNPATERRLQAAGLLTRSDRAD